MHQCTAVGVMRMKSNILHPGAYSLMVIGRRFSPVVFHAVYRYFCKDSGWQQTSSADCFTGVYMRCWASLEVSSKRICPQ